MLKAKALAGTVLAATVIGGCDGGRDADSASRSATDPGGERAKGGAERRPSSRRGAKPIVGENRADGRTAERCKGAIRLHDPRNDTRSWVQPEPPGRPPTPPAADLRRFELRADRHRVCVRWALAAPAPPGTTLVFFGRGPARRRPGGGAVIDQYGFEVALLAAGARVTYATDPNSAPIPRARVRRSGATILAVVGRSELDGAPADMRDRPPFPFRSFVVETRVITPRDRRGGQDVDFWPQQSAGQAAYIRGRLCGPPCKDRRLWAGIDAKR